MTASQVRLSECASGPVADNPGLWFENKRSVRSDNALPKPGLFLDRDGVLNIDTGYVGNSATAQVLTNLSPLIKTANDRHWPVIVVTNQSGIARGYYDWQNFCAVNAKICATLDFHDAHIDMIIACAYHNDGLPPYNEASHPWRKPSPGMLLQAAEALHLDLKSSLIVGDRITDMEAGARAGVKHGLLVRHGRTEPTTAQTLKGFNMTSLKTDTAEWQNMSATWCAQVWPTLC